MRVVIESPFKGANYRERIRNIHFARECMYDSLQRGEYPFLSHLLYTQILDDDVTEERNWGIKGQIAYIDACDKVVVYQDKGISGGMQAAINHATDQGIPIEYRWLSKQLPLPLGE